MFNIVKKEINWGGKTLSLETGLIARQASGAVIAKMGDATVLCAVTVAKKAVEGADFFPLTVHYQEKFYAAGKIPGGFLKRETKPSESAVLISRLIDRPIRPLFPESFYNEVNVVCTVLSYDNTVPVDVLSLIGASAALEISEAPFLEPVACAKVGYINDQFVLNPNFDEIKDSKLDLVVAGTESSVLMVESEAKELSEEKMLEAVKFGHDNFQPVIQLIKDFKEASPKKEKLKPTISDIKEITKNISEFTKDRLVSAFKLQDKISRYNEIDNIKNSTIEKFVDENNDKNKVNSIFKSIEKDIVRSNILNENIRIDGRKIDQIRQIDIRIDLLPKVHGSALFTRGETQALVITTLGTGKDEQLIDTPEFQGKESFMLHYNFPPYSVGEVGQLKSPGRREIGHGKLAWRAINPVFPSADESFNFVTRVVSEITESNGSSSMASVCGTSLSLMAAGVPIKRSVSGIAMGLIKEQDKYAILSDIMGDEDHLGDMDFKVAGTKEGITALQMDIKINGINQEIMEKSLKQANKGRLEILEKMDQVISSPNKSFNDNVPKVETINISPKKIKDIIGAKGKVIKDICLKTGATIDIDDSGQVKISGTNKKSIDEAISIINDIAFEPEVGDIYSGPVVKIIDAGAFVSISNNKDGFVHISELAEYRVDFVEDIIKESQIVKVKVIGFDKKGRPKLSYKSVDQVTGEDISKEEVITSESFKEESETPKKKKGFFS